MPLFQKSVLKKYLATLDTTAVDTAWQRFAFHFLDPVKQENIRRSKEEQYQEGFLRELFVDVLGYTLNPSPGFNLTTELKNVGNARKCNGGILHEGGVLGVNELKGTDTVDLTKVETQAFGYKSHQPGCRYVIISNYERLRFFIDDATAHEEFDLFTLTPELFRLLYLLLAAPGLFAGVPARIRQESAFEEEDITRKFYRDYSAFKSALFEDLVQRNPAPHRDLTNFQNLSNLPPGEWKILLFRKSQKLLDRLLFIFFGEDKGLLPPNFIKRTIDDWDRLRDMDEYRPLYEQFRKYFQYIREGVQRKDLQVFAYNGGLFEPDEVLDHVKISDPVLYKYTLELSRYDFADQVDVNILGHIFEHSLNDIEEISARLSGTDFDRTQTKRKKDGVFYTPKYITQYIVEHTVGRLCTERKAALGIVDEAYAQERKGRKDAVRKSLNDQLETYRQWLFGLKICDPACGSGAFLNEAFDFLIREHAYVTELYRLLNGDSIPFSVENRILENNLYGVDINEEAVEIARLALWLRSAAPGRRLTTLSSHLKVGNSLIDDPAVAGDKAFNWEKEFPEVFAQGGFDVVVGNPPYVRQEVISPFKPYLEKTYQTYHGAADLFVYFIEKGITMLKPDGLYSIIVANKWMKAGYGRPLRQWLKQKQLVEIIDFGELPVFPDATTYPCVLTVASKRVTENHNFNVTEPNDLKFSSLNQFVKNNQFSVAQNSLKEEGWNLNNNLNGLLLEKISSIGLPLSRLIKGKIFRGILTGLNEAFVINEKTKNELIQKESKSAEIIKPFIAGRDVKRYFVEFSNNYLLKVEKGWTNRNRNDKEPWEYFSTKYPAVAEYMLQFKEQAEKRLDKGDHWWELRTCDYYEEFEKQKIVYQEIATFQSFAYDKENYYCNNKIFFFPGAKEWLLAYLNAKIVWYYLGSTVSKLQGGAYAMQSPYILSIPLPETAIEHPQLQEYGVLQLENHQKNKEMVSQLTRLLTRRFSLPTLSQKLEDWPKLTYKDFAAELNKLLLKTHKRKLTLSEEMEWEPVFVEAHGRASLLQADITRTDREIDALVYALYGLTEEEIRVVEGRSEI